MLFLMFRLENDSFAVEAGQIEEVLPLLALTTIPMAPRGIAGAFSYHGVSVPVLDLAAMALGRPAHRRLSTRLILLHYAARDRSTRLLGLIAEQATDTLRCDPSDFADSGVSSPGAPFLGPVATVAGRLVQRVRVDQLISAEVAEALFHPGPQAG